MTYLAKGRVDKVQLIIPVVLRKGIHCLTPWFPKDQVEMRAHMVCSGCKMVHSWVPKCSAIACMTYGHILQLFDKFNLLNISAAAFILLATHYGIHVMFAWSNSSCSFHRTAHILVERENPSLMVATTMVLSHRRHTTRTCKWV